jgi:hypothetical protein
MHSPLSFCPSPSRSATPARSIRRRKSIHLLPVQLGTISVGWVAPPVHNDAQPASYIGEQVFSVVFITGSHLPSWFAQVATRTKVLMSTLGASNPFARGSVATTHLVMDISKVYDPPAVTLPLTTVFHGEAPRFSRYVAKNRRRRSLHQTS